ncbi:MAG: DNA polymerase III subunit delta [Hyphomonas sp.]|uniref:DNA polymerase III subunit delta n=1 Tax=Hyphomonas sp. TaxID=87 RepID=UPI003528EF51
MLLQGKQAIAFARKPDPKIWAVLAFSEDEGLASDTGQSVLAAWVGKGPPADVTLLDDEAIKKDPALLFDALEAVSLLGDMRIVRIRTSGDKIAGLLSDAFAEGDKVQDRFGARLLIEAGSLQKKSKLRAAAEAAGTVAALHLFADEAVDIEGKVKQALLEAGATIDADALHAFVGDLPGHRLAANSEIEKLSLYARGLGRALSMADIRALSATELEQTVTAAIDATLDGRPGDANHAFDRLAMAGTAGIGLLRSLQFEVRRMLDAHMRIAEGQPSPNMKLRPPVWQSAWPSYRARLNKWPVRRLTRVLERIYDAEEQAKRAGGSADAVVRMLMNELARAAEAAR